MISAKEIIGQLTDVFVKNPISNIAKLLTIMTNQLKDLEDTFIRIREWRDIDKAEGTTLDRIGSIVNQPRGAATDEVYRILIKSKIARNLSTGDINTIIQVLSTALNTAPSTIQIQEMWNDPVMAEPAAISVIRLPLESINKVGMSPNQLARIVQKTVAAGVRVGTIELAGSFQFASGGTVEVDDNAGFADQDGTVGGTLGYVYIPGEDNDLPI